MKALRPAPQPTRAARNLVGPQADGAKAPAAAGGKATSVADEATTARPLNAPEIAPAERVIKEFPDPKYGAAKLALIAKASTGEAGAVLAKAAGAAGRILTRAAFQPREGGNFNSEGRLLRQARVFNGKHRVRVVFQPAAGGKPTPVNPSAVVGVPNGAIVKLNRDGTVDTKGAEQLHNMVGVVEKRGDTYYAVSQSELAPISALPLEGGDDALIGKTVVVDVQDPTADSRKGLIHDVLTSKSPLQALELTIAAASGIYLTYPPEVLAQVQRLKDNPPQFEPLPGVRDLRNLPLIATDNPGSTSDYRSIDPEQASNVSFEGGRMVLTDLLANRKLLVPSDSPLDAHAMKVMQTFYGSGFAAAALPPELSEDLAVFLKDQPRYATAVRAVYDIVPTVVDASANLDPAQRSVTELIDGQRNLRQIGEQLGDLERAEQVVRALADSATLRVDAKLALDQCEVFDALIANRWAGSYREADRVYAEERGDPKAQGTAATLPEGVQEQLDAFRFAYRALSAAPVGRGQLNAGGNDDRYLSEKVREQFSTSINEIIGLLCEKAGVDFIQRGYFETKEEKIDRFRQFSEAIGVRWEKNESLAEFIDAIPARLRSKFADKSPGELAILIDALGAQGYRSLKKTIYLVDSGEHADLARKTCAHSTASNRKNTGKPNLDQATYASDKLRGRAEGHAPYTKEQLTEIADHATEVDWLHARVIERQVESVRNAMALKAFAGRTLKAVVTRANPGGIELTTIKPSSKVFVPMAVLADAFKARFDLARSSTEVSAPAVGVAFRLGQTVDLQIKSVRPELGSVDAAPVAKVAPNAPGLHPGNSLPQPGEQ